MWISRGSNFVHKGKEMSWEFSKYEGEMSRDFRGLSWCKKLLVRPRHRWEIDIFVNCNWVNTRWQCYSTHNQYIEQHHNNRTTPISAQHNNNIKTIAQHNDNYFWRVRTVPRLVSLTLAFALQLRKKHGKPSVRVLKDNKKGSSRIGVETWNEFVCFRTRTSVVFFWMW